MAFCGNCGTQVNGQMYCTNCGAYINDSKSNSESNFAHTSLREAMRATPELALQEIDGLIAHFQAIEPTYNQLQKSMEELNKRQHKRILRWIFAAPFITVGSWFLVTKLDFINYNEILGLIYLALSVILPFGLPIRGKIRNVLAIRRLKKAIPRLTEEVDNHFRKYDQSTSLTSYDFNPHTLHAIRNTILAGKATSVYQALAMHNAANSHLGAYVTREDLFP